MWRSLGRAVGVLAGGDPPGADDQVAVLIETEGRPDEVVHPRPGRIGTERALLVVDGADQRRRRTVAGQRQPGRGSQHRGVHVAVGLPSFGRHGPVAGRQRIPIAALGRRIQMPDLETAVVRVDHQHRLDVIGDGVAAGHLGMSQHRVPGLGQDGAVGQSAEGQTTDGH